MVIGIKCSGCGNEMDKATFYGYGAARVTSAAIAAFTPVMIKIISDRFNLEQQRGFFDYITYATTAAADGMKYVITIIDHGIAGYAINIGLKCPQCEKIRWVLNETLNEETEQPQEKVLQTKHVKKQARNTTHAKNP